mmetsp:Transcript_5022/g.4814  ORF Transcript_5022/g.4814 Transcript_5022/m.4814 type:complete len:106 (+) Transcript_5022:315-632(+)
MQVAVYTYLKNYMLKKEGLTEDNASRSPVKSSKDSPPPSVFSFQESDVNKESAGPPPSRTLQGEEAKEGSKFFDLPLNFNTKVKKGTPRELGFDASFSSLTMKDF